METQQLDTLIQLSFALDTQFPLPVMWNIMYCRFHTGLINQSCQHNYNLEMPATYCWLKAILYCFLFLNFLRTVMWPFAVF